MKVFRRAHRVRSVFAFLTALVLLVPAATPRAAAQSSPEAVRATLSNGLRVVVVRNALAPVVTVYTNYLAGGNDTPAGFPGTAHAEEHMAASRDLQGLTSGQVATVTTLLGGDFNADTQQTVTQYYVSAPAASLDVALHIEAARMTKVLNLQSQWALERGAIEQEVSSDNSNAFFRFYEKALGVLFAGTPYATSPLGTRPSFQKTTGPDLAKFYKTWYAPNNAIMVIVGDVEPDQAIAQVKAILGAVPRRTVGTHAAFHPQPVKPGVTIRDQGDLPVPIVLLAYRMPGYRDRDFAAAEIAVDVLNSERGTLAALAYSGKILGGGFQYEPFASTGLTYGLMELPPGSDTGAGGTLLADTIAGIVKDGLPADLVEAAKKREVAQALYSRNSIEGLAGDWSDALAVQGLSSPDDILQRLNAVTVDDANRALRTYLQRASAVAGILTPKAAGAGSSSGGGFAVKDTFGSADTKPVPLPSWASSLATVPPVPKSNVSPAEMTLSNGIKLIVVPLSVSKTVTLSGGILTNPFLQTPEGKDGVRGVLDGMFPYGTQTYDRLAFQTQLDAIAADVQAGSSFGLNVPSQDFERGVALLADNELHPLLPASAFTVVQQQVAQLIGGTLTTPNYIAGRALESALLPKGDPSLRETTPETVRALGLQDVKNYYASVYRPDMTTIVVAGDVTAEQARSTIERYFGAWKATGPKPSVVLSAVPANGPFTQSVPAAGRTQTSVTLALELPDFTRRNADYYALQLGDAILGGGFYSTRFSRDLRKDNGLVYSIGAGLAAGRSRGMYRVDYGSDPGNVNKARALIERELRDLAKTPPSDAEVAQAKTQVLRDLALSESSVEAIASGLLGRSLAELPLDEPVRTGQAILELRPSDVTAAFAKWIDPAKFVQVTTGPAPT